MNKINKIVIGGLLVVSGFIGGQKVGFEKMKSVYEPIHYEAINDEAPYKSSDVYGFDYGRDDLAPVPLKAFNFTVDGKEYFYAEDGQGELHLLLEEVDVNKNYIGLVVLSTGKLLEINDSSIYEWDDDFYNYFNDETERRLSEGLIIKQYKNIVSPF